MGLSNSARSVGVLGLGPRRFRRTATVLFLLVPWLPSAAQAASYDLGLRVAYAAAVESGARFDRVFDSQWPELGQGNCTTYTHAGSDR